MAPWLVQPHRCKNGFHGYSGLVATDPEDGKDVSAS